MEIKEKVSVIVPVYNVEKYLPTCIDSLINQTYHNLEIILIDDGSKDQSGKICDEYVKKDQRIADIPDFYKDKIYSKRLKVSLRKIIGLIIKSEELTLGHKFYSLLMTISFRLYVFIRKLVCKIKKNKVVEK